MIIIKTDRGKIFGGYSDISITSTHGYKEGFSNTFIFSLRDDEIFIKLKNLDREREVYHHSNWLCNFGGNDGFFILNDCNINY